MRDLVVLFIHFIATLARLLGPGGARSIVAESLLLKHQLLILNRSRRRSPGHQPFQACAGRARRSLRLHGNSRRTRVVSFNYDRR
jgi:hypothetical protein